MTDPKPTRPAGISPDQSAGMIGASSRRLANAAAVSAVGGAVSVTVALVAGPSPGLTGYVSEAGITGSAFAPAYQLGVAGLAAALLLLAVALPRQLRAVAVLLGVGAVATALSGAVTCSDGCPLPPFERATVADLVHGGAAVAGVACCVFAMLMLAAPGLATGGLGSAGYRRWPAANAALGRLARLPAPDAAVHRLAVTGTVVALPLASAVGAAMLLFGRGAVVGLLERVLLACLVTWTTVTALTVARR